MLLELGGNLVGYFDLNYYEKYPIVCGRYEFLFLNWSVHICGISLRNVKLSSSSKALECRI